MRPLFCLLVIGVYSIDDAHLTKAPSILCAETNIQVTLLTNSPFDGNIYAKGFFDRPHCRVEGNSSGNIVNITVPINAECGMRRRRVPKGLIFEVTMVLMFHRRFLTRHDKVFHIECVYGELSQRYTRRLEISVPPSNELRDSSEIISLRSEAELPKCRYEVLNADERPLGFATVGQTIIHKWWCESETKTSGRFCLTVHSCEVDDGHGNHQTLLDSSGCPVDKTLLNEIHYESPLSAVRQSFVFKFADKPTIYFGCQLRLEPKGENECSRTSDSCPTTIDPDFPRPPNDSIMPFPTPSDPFEFPTTVPTVQVRPSAKTIEENSDLQQLDVPVVDFALPKRVLPTAKKTERKFSGPTIEMDVNAPGVDVMDTTQWPSVTPHRRPLIDVSSSKQQVCVSRHLLSVAILVASGLLFLLAVIFCGTLWRFVRRPRVVFLGRRSARFHI